MTQIGLRSEKCGHGRRRATPLSAEDPVCTTVGLHRRAAVRKTQIVFKDIWRCYQLAPEMNGRIKYC